eukprot:Gregarina_sp_Poly_1__5141@NODE_271_length_10278_cov_119_025561_g236_i0_p1_GENE_NODE_271_length_10278_cov_119_025561_g236_i0NODE_271_length_10278_cov_119_025561_g236_i0_p1_ORF_typecomplete_len857_score104_81Pcc1/PF09341_10/0_064_NODE_271_length_10278_cov_119_025561_g236_i050827652
MKFESGFVADILPLLDAIGKICVQRNFWCDDVLGRQLSHHIGLVESLCERELSTRGNNCHSVLEKAHLNIESLIKVAENALAVGEQFSIQLLWAAKYMDKISNTHQSANKREIEVFEYLRPGFEFLCSWLLFDYVTQEVQDDAQHNGFKELCVPFHFTTLLTFWTMLLFAGSFAMIDQDTELILVTINRSFGSRRMKGRLAETSRHRLRRAKSGSTLGLRVMRKSSSRLKVRRRSLRRKSRGGSTSPAEGLWSHESTNAHDSKRKHPAAGSWPTTSLAAGNPQLRLLLEIASWNLLHTYIALQRVAWRRATTCYVSHLLPVLGLTPKNLGVLRCTEVILFWRASCGSVASVATTSFPLSLLDVPSPFHSRQRLEKALQFDQGLSVLRPSREDRLSQEALAAIRSLRRMPSVHGDIREQTASMNAVKNSIMVDPSPYFPRADISKPCTNKGEIGEHKLLRDLPVLRNFLYKRLLSESTSVCHPVSPGRSRLSNDQFPASAPHIEPQVVMRSRSDWQMVATSNSRHRRGDSSDSLKSSLLLQNHPAVSSDSPLVISTPSPNDAGIARRSLSQDNEIRRLTSRKRSARRRETGHFVTCTRRTSGTMETRLPGMKFSHSLIFRRSENDRQLSPGRAGLEFVLDLISDSSDEVINMWRGSLRDELLPFSEPTTELSFLLSLSSCALLAHLVLMAFEEDVVSLDFPLLQPWVPSLLTQLCGWLGEPTLASAEAAANVTQMHFDSDIGCWVARNSQRTGCSVDLLDNCLSVGEALAAVAVNLSGGAALVPPLPQEETLLVTVARVVRRLCLQQQGSVHGKPHISKAHTVATHLIQTAFQQHSAVAIYEALLLREFLDGTEQQI